MLPSIFGENLFDDLFDRTFEKEFFGGRNPLYGKHAGALMKTDVREKDDQDELAVDLPGFSKDEISAELKDGYLTIRASKGLDKDEKDKDGRYIRRERYCGQCQRSFYVGDVRPENIGAKYEDGVLKLTLPKAQPKQLETANHIAIE